MTATLNVRTERNPYFLDGDRVPTRVKDNDEVLNVAIDYSDALASGETLSTSSWSSDGPTVANAALSTPVASCDAGIGLGDLENTVTTSAGQTLIRRLRFVRPSDGVSSGNDYRY